MEGKKKPLAREPAEEGDDSQRTAPSIGSRAAFAAAAPLRGRRPHRSSSPSPLPPPPPGDDPGGARAPAAAPPPSSPPLSAATNWRTRPFTGEFRDPALERAFWLHLRDSGRLSQLDAPALAMLSFCLLTGVAAFSRRGMNPWPCTCGAAATLLLAAAARGRWRVYEEHRTLAASLARVAVVLSTCSGAFLSSPLFAQAWGAMFLQSGGSRSSGAAHAAALALATRGAIVGGGVGGGGGGVGGAAAAAAAAAAAVGGSGSSGSSGSSIGGSPSAFAPPTPASTVSALLASSSSSSSGFRAASFGAGVPGHWISAAASASPWARHWSAFFARTPRVQALLLPSLLVMPPRAHALVSLLCALVAVAALGSTVAGREAYFGREKHVEVARVLSSLTRWLVRLPSSNAAAAMSGNGCGGGVGSGSASGTGGDGLAPPFRAPPLPLRRQVAEDRATAAVMLVMQLCLGLVLPTHVMFAWQSKARRAFRDAELAKRRERETTATTTTKKKKKKEEEEEEKGEGEEVGVALRRRRVTSSSSPSSSSPLSPPTSSKTAALLMRSAGVDSALLALGLQVSTVVCFWFVLEELDALAGERKLWFSLP